MELPTLDQATFTRRLEGIRRGDPVQGPLAASWLLSSLARRLRGRERLRMLEQADLLTEEAVDSLVEQLVEELVEVEL